MNSSKHSVTKLVAGVFAVLILAGCSDEKADLEPKLRPIRYMVVQDPSTERVRTFSGSSKSAQESRLSFQVPGTVAEIPVQVGDELKKGDMVARLDPSQYELQVQQAQASLVQAQANARNAQSAYDRVKGLYENNNASRNDLDSARANAESAKAQQRASQKALELAKLNLSYTRLEVDVDCSIASLSVEINENVGSGTQVAQVNCGKGLEVIIDVPESLIAEVKQGMAVDVLFDAMPGKYYQGSVIEIGVSSAGASATFPISVALLSPDSAIRSGLAAEVTFRFTPNGSTAAFIVPLASVVNDVDGPFVFIANPDAVEGQAIVQRTPIRLGELTEQGMEVLDGIRRGDRLVTAGVSVIRDGQRVLLP